MAENKKMNHVLLMMGGSGTRFGASKPKQFVEVEGKPVFSYIMQAYERFYRIDTITLVCHPEWTETATKWANKLEILKFLRCVEGGATRSQSVLNGLKSLADVVGDDDIVLIHDATHPYLDEAATALAMQAAAEFGAATLGQKQYDTVYKCNDDGMLSEVVPRQYVVSGASPELFRFADLYKAYKECPPERLDACTSAGALALEAGIKMKVITTELVNLKITYKHDMELFQKLFRGYYF